MIIETYSPAKVEVNYGGHLAMSGFAEGTFIEAQRNDPETTTVKGAKGDIGITYNAGTDGTLTVTLLQNSVTNEYLSAIVKAQGARQNVIRADITIKDPSGAFLCYCRRCHIQEPAPVMLGDGQNAKVWKFFVEDLHYADVPQGTYKVLSDAADVAAQIGTISDALKTTIN